MAKKKPSGFSLFMFEFISKEKREGRNHPKANYSNVAAPYWERLSPNEKEAYKQRAKTQPSHTKMVSTSPKYTTHGLLISDVENEHLRRKENKIKADKKVKDFILNAFNENVIGSIEIFYIMANYFCVTNEGVYVPAELSIVKFNFEKGRLKEFHVYINPLQIPSGFAYEARYHSSKEHKLPVPPNALGSSNFQQIYFDICLFCRSSTYNGPSYLFTDEKEMPMIESIMNQLSDHAYKEKFEILSLNQLFNVLVNNVEPEPQNTNITNMFIKKDSYDFAANIACEYHVEAEVELKCSLSIAQRWMFTTCAKVCDKIGIDVKCGFHKPINTEEYTTANDNKNVQIKTNDEQNKNNDNSDDDFMETESQAETVTSTTSTTYSQFSQFGRNNPFVSDESRPSSTTSFTTNNSVEYPMLGSRRKGKIVDTRRRYFE